MLQTIGVVRETFTGEKRVATVPDVVKKLIKLGFSVLVEAGAGAAADFDDDSYRAAGALIAPGAAQVWATADVMLKVRAPAADEVAQLRPGTTLIGFIWPGQHPALMDQLAARDVTVLAMDSVPRMSRAQKLDALSSMANIAGYRAVIEAAYQFGRFFTGQITAAGKVPPAKVFVIGAGVAGLAAIGAASSLGAVARANDTRPEVADQVRSMGAAFVPVDFQEAADGIGGYAKTMSEGFQAAQRATFATEAQNADIIVTTALIPGKPAPKLISAAMVQSMRAGSVIVDLAAEQGGNCELTVPGEVVVRHGVTIVGYTDMASRLSGQASTLYASNLLHLVEELCKAKDGKIDVNMDDEVIRGATVVKDGSITWPPPPPRLSAQPAVKAAPAAAPAAAASAKKGHAHGQGAPVKGSTIAILSAVAAGFFWVIGAFAPPAFLGHLTVFVLACFIGYMVVWNVTPSLHTPLMSVTNAVSSIVVIGALVQVAPPLAAGAPQPEELVRWLALAGIVLTSINMFGGFAVTRRMLAMFRK